MGYVMFESWINNSNIMFKVMTINIEQECYVSFKYSYMLFGDLVQVLIPIMHMREHVRSYGI